MKYFCNPMNLPYKYQFFQNGARVTANREAADPTVILFNGLYYMFPSMTAGFYVSDDLHTWSYHPLPANIPMHDYAPDVRQIGEWMYFSASKRQSICNFYRTKDPVSGCFEEIDGSFPFWDPHLFQDGDGRVYFYWGCSNTDPIYGLELNPETMKPLGEKQELIFGDTKLKGFDRPGENHVSGKTPEDIEQNALRIARKYLGVQELSQLSPEVRDKLRKSIDAPYVEGAWLDKHNGKYYLQYATPGTQFNVYGDGVYIGDSPLGPFVLSKNNPFSYKPGGFVPGAGHGSSLMDKNGAWWHISTMRISVNHEYERRLGLWKAGFDCKGEFFCDQRFGDWPMRMDQKPWEKPDWMLLSYGKTVSVSSGANAEKICDENVQTWWRAGSRESGQWAQLDLGTECDVRAIQINFADDGLVLDLPDGMELCGETEKRAIDQKKRVTRWILEGSPDGEKYFTIEDKSKAETDLSHDLIICEQGVKCRFIKLTVIELPFDQHPCVSGIRVFGNAGGAAPDKASGVNAKLAGDLDMTVSWSGDDAIGHNVLWGFAPEKLYHSYMVFGKSEQKIGALIKGEPVYLRVDAFNEAGITEGEVICVKSHR